jgi:hypothetical protein
VGSPEDVILDPTDPSTVYTAHDVEVRFNAGWGALAVTGVAIAVLGGAGLIYIGWL